MHRQPGVKLICQAFSAFPECSARALQQGSTFLAARLQSLKAHLFSANLRKCGKERLDLRSRSEIR